MVAGDWAPSHSWDPERHLAIVHTERSTQCHIYPISTAVGFNIHARSMPRRSTSPLIMHNLDRALMLPTPAVEIVSVWVFRGFQWTLACRQTGSPRPGNPLDQPGPTPHGSSQSTITPMSTHRLGGATDRRPPTAASSPIKWPPSAPVPRHPAGTLVSRVVRRCPPCVGHPSPGNHPPAGGVLIHETVSPLGLF